MNILECLKGLKDSRRDHCKKYALAEVVLISILAILSGACSYRKIHTYFESKLPYFKVLLGINWERSRCYTTIRNILHSINHEELETAFRKNCENGFDDIKKDTMQLACDGKVLRGSFDHFEDQKAVQLLSLFCVNEGITLAHFIISDKSNEIPAFQTLVKELGLSNKVFSADALHCQKKHLKL